MDAILTLVLVVLEHFARQPVLVAVMVLVLTMLCGFGRSFGLPSLIYHPRVRTRVANALAIGALIGWIAFVAHLKNWESWAGQTGFDMEMWDKRFSPVPAHVGYLALYTTVAVVFALAFAVPLAMFARPAGRPAGLGSGTKLGFVCLMLVGWVVFLAAAGVAARSLPNEAGSGAIYRVKVEAVETPFDVVPVTVYVAEPWPRYARIWLACGVLTALVTASLVVAIPGVRRYAPRVSPIAIFALALVGVTGAIDGLGLALDWAVYKGLTLFGFGEQLGSHRDEWLRNAVGLTNLVVVGLVLMLTCAAGVRKFRSRLPNLPGADPWDDLYRPGRQVKLDPPAASQLPAPLPVNAQRPSASPGSDREPVVVVAVSGGGIAAAVWAFAVLTELDNRTRAVNATGGRPFPKAAKLITGASGGMLGAAYYVALAADPDADISPDWASERGCIAGDCLSPVVRAHAFHDLVWSLLPFDSGYDRGRALERAWADNLRGALSGSIAALAAAEREGRIPSLVFSPMLVEDGRRLVVSNTDFRWLHRQQPRSYVEFSKLFSGGLKRLSIATAVRMSATFPLISPAVVLPTDPPRRVVDAGYFDNYGVHLAAAWIRQLRVDHAGNPPPVALIEVRAFDRLEPSEPGLLKRGWEDLLTPIDGLSTARQAMTAYRNDELLQLLEGEMGDGFKRYVIQCPRDPKLPLSWFLTPDERDRIINGVSGDVCKPLTEFMAWWTKVHSLQSG